MLSLQMKSGEYLTIGENIAVQVFQAGECCYTSPRVMDIREYCKKEQETLWDETRRLVNPHKVYVDLSSRLYDIKIQLLDQMSQS